MERRGRFTENAVRAEYQPKLTFFYGLGNSTKNHVRCSLWDGPLFHIRFIVALFKGVQAVEAGAKILELQPGAVRRPYARQAFRQDGSPGQASDVGLRRQPCLSCFLPLDDINR